MRFFPKVWHDSGGSHYTRRFVSGAIYPWGWQRVVRILPGVWRPVGPEFCRHDKGFIRGPLWRQAVPKDIHPHTAGELVVLFVCGLPFAFILAAAAIY